MPIGRIETAISKVPLLSRITTRLDEVRGELARRQDSSRSVAFDHTAAQRYELTHAERWLRDNADAFRPMIDHAKRGAREIHPLTLREFFADDSRLWRDFAPSLEGKGLLDVGGGPIPAPAIWRWAAKRYVLDPLANDYKRLADAIDPTWFEGITLYHDTAETFIPELEGAIDGAIVCRNCLDHCAEPYLVLSNIASYAAPGCALLLWSDLFHLDGHDEGHTDITCDKAGFRQLIVNLGFEIVRDVPEASGRGTINFGCFAVKRTVRGRPLV